MTSIAAPTWDLFCKVVDNYGDVGVCWRLVRQLAEERGHAVRLWCDDLAALARLCPAADPAKPAQRLHGVDVRHWGEDFSPVVPADVVIEAFACDIPAEYVAAMASRSRRPVWINLEYLSAEAWVADCHRLASPHPHLPLLKHFFFPGFTIATGGLLREQDLIRRRDAFQAIAVDWSVFGLAPPAAAETSVFLFGYENPALPALIAAWADSETPVRCLVPEGRSLAQLSGILGEPALSPGDTRNQGRLTIHALPFVPQERFDPLLWACDLNFVRGEDSFVRGQWAGRPLVWHIYPQDDEAHRLKLDAFLDRYCADLPASAANACRRFWHAWNHGGTLNWSELSGQLPTLRAHAQEWAKQLLNQADLATNLVNFVGSQLK